VGQARAAAAGAKLNFKQVVAQPLRAALAAQAEKFSLDRVLPQHFGLLKTAFETAQRYPQIQQGFQKFYGADCFSRWAGHHKQALDQTLSRQALDLSPREKQASDAPRAYAGPLSLLPQTVKTAAEHPTKSGALSIYVYESTSVTRNGEELDETGKDQLTIDDRADLQHHGYLVKDERTGEQISKAYNTQVEQRLSNPQETGLWNVLEKPGKFSRMLVISNPHSNQGRQNFCTVVRISDSSDKSWLNAHRTQLWADQVEERRDFESWFKSLGDKESLTKDAVYLAIDDSGSGTVPFRVREVYGDGRYKVDFRDSVDWSQRRSPDMPHLERRDDFDSHHISHHGAIMVVDAEHRRGTQLRAIQGELRVPGNFKFMELKKPPKSKPTGLLADCCCIGEDEPETKDEPILPGKLDDIQLMFHEKTARLKIYDMSNEVAISSPQGMQQLQKQAAFLSLIRDHGFGVETSRQMLKEAERKGQSVYRVRYAPIYLEKSAAPNWSALSGGPNAPPFQEPEVGMEMLGNRNAVNTRYPDEQQMPVDELSASQYDQSQHDIWQNYTHEDFQKTMSTAQQAAGDGQKEVFDTAMIGGMLKAVRQDSLVDRYLGDLIKALDKLGRILFMFYWHQEEFEDRYGKQDLPELEDSLRNAFEVLGDVVLFLKKKTVQTDFDDSGNLDIEESARN
jgi:hypothetical protein